MDLFYYRGAVSNFGDALNPWLWPKVLPGFFDENAEEVFLGIGSILGLEPKGRKKTIVLGAGYVPHYHPKPDINDGDWHIYAVRGKRTAQLLDLPVHLAVTDPAVLVALYLERKEQASAEVSFMPHWQSMEDGKWQRACQQAGIQLIDPRWPIEQVFSSLLRTRLLISEAMHGAIVADALRIPWVPVLPLQPIHRAKWHEWSESLAMDLRPRRLWPSSLRETGMGLFRRDDRANSFSALSSLKQATQASVLAPWVESKLVDLAAYRLSRLARCSGMLSDDKRISEATDKLLTKISQLRQDFS